MGLPVLCFEEKYRKKRRGGEILLLFSGFQSAEIIVVFLIFMHRNPRYSNLIDGDRQMRSPAGLPKYQMIAVRTRPERV